MWRRLLLSNDSSELAERVKRACSAGVDGPAIVPIAVQRTFAEEDVAGRRRVMPPAR
jgi:hypothetical protein